MDPSDTSLDLSKIDTSLDLSKIDNPQMIDQVSCLFCRGTVKFNKFFQHIQNEHDVLFDLDLILKLCLLGREKLEDFVNKPEIVKNENKSGDTKEKMLQNNKIDVINKKDIKPEIEDYEILEEPNTSMENDWQPKDEKYDIAEIPFKKKKCKDENISNSSLAFTCEICSKSFNTLSWFYNHCKKCHPDNPEILPQNYAKLGPLDTLHSRIPDEKGEFTCGLSNEVERCNLSFTRFLSLVHHERTHKSAFLCILCGLACHNADTLISHTNREHEDVSTYMCRICGFLNRTHRNLKDHTEEEHMGGGVRYQCDECEQTFDKVNAFKAHKRLAHKDAGKTYMCDTCGKTYFNPSSLYLHTLSHNPDGKKFPCDYCTKAFHLASKLKIHLKVHTGEKSECCDVCGKNFGSKTELKTHKKNVHIEEKDKPFGCDYCGKRFSNMTVYKNHCKLHTGVRDEMCTICGKGFVTRRALRKHERSVHPSLKPIKEKPFKINTTI